MHDVHAKLKSAIVTHSVDLRDPQRSLSSGRNIIETCHPIAIVCEYPSVLGGERSLLATLDWAFAHERLSPADCTAIIPAGPIQLAFAARNCPTVCWPLGITTAYERVDFLRNLCEQKSIPRVHANSLAMGRITGQLCRSSGVRCTAHLRDIIRPSHQALEDLASNDQLIAVSHATRNHYLELGIPADRIQTIWNGIDVAEWSRPASNAIRDELGIGHRDLMLTSVGQIGLRKGQLTIARAARAIIAEVPDAHFVLVGERYSQKPESVAYHQQIREFFDDPLLRERFHETGSRQDIPALFSETDIVIHAANQEPFGRVILEAMATGRPVVATDVGGTRELIDDGQSGWLVPPNDPEAFARAVILLAKKPDLRHGLGERARERARAMFTLEKSATALIKVWQRATAPE